MLSLDLQNLAFHQKNAGQTDGATNSIEEAIRIQKELIQKRPTTFLGPLASSYRMLAYLKKEKGLIDEAIHWGEQALEIQYKLVAQQPNVPERRYGLALLHNNVASYKQKARALADAQQLAERGIEIQRELVDQYPKVVKYRSNLANSFGILSSIKHERELLTEALLARQQALEFYHSLHEQIPGNPNFRHGFMNSHIWVGRMERTLQDEFVAQSHFQQAIECLSETLESERSADDWGYLAKALYELGQFQESSSAAARAIELNGDEDPDSTPRWWIRLLSEARLGNLDLLEGHFHALAKAPKTDQNLELRMYRDQAALVLELDQELGK